MKTFFIWNMFGEGDGLKYGSVDYDASSLDKKYVNDSATTGGEEEELDELQARCTWYPSLSAWAEQILIDADDQTVFIETGFFP